MKMVRKGILLVLFFVLIPFMVSAHNLEDLELKWTDEIEDDGYIFNPIIELDSNYAKYYYGYNDSKFIETDDGYLVIGNYSISLFDRKKGLVNSVDFVEYVKDGDNYIAMDYDSEHETYSIKLFNKRLDLIDESETFDYYIDDLIDFFVEDDSLVVVYEMYDDANGNYLNSLVLDKETLKEKHSSKLLTGNYTYYYSNKIYCDSYNNYYYLDDNFNIIPNNLNDDGSYFVSGASFLVLLDKNGKELKSVEIEPSDDYERWSGDTSVRKYNNFYYVLSKEYKYVSWRKYLHRVVYYKYDSDFKLVDSKILTGESTSSSGSYYASLYTNQEGVFTYYSYNNQYYKIEDDFNFTTSDSSYMYDEIEKNVVSQKEPEANIQLKAYYFSDYYLDKLASEREEKLEKNLDENGSAYVYFSYDTYYDEDNEQLIIAVTWRDAISNSGNSEYYTESELIFVDEENFESPTRVTLTEREKYKGTDYLYYRAVGAKMYVDDDNIIVALGLGDKIIINIYDRTGKLIKTLSEKKAQCLSPQMVSYNNGKLLVIFSALLDDTPQGISSTNFTGNNSSDVSLSDLSSLPVLYGEATYSYIEYYETPFIINTKTDGNGTIESTKVKASSGEEIKFTIIPKDGYVLKNVKVTDSSGNVVVFTDYTFTMPSSDVTIEASFVPENPNTADLLIIGLIVLFGLGIVWFIRNKKKVRWLSS